MKFNIVIGGIHIESSTFSSYISKEEDFNITRGKEILKRYELENIKDVNLFPTVHARALPGGVVDRNFYEKWLDEIIARIQEIKNEYHIDGFLFDIHGAMSVQGLEDAEGDTISKIREALGTEVIISTSMDLHGNVSDKLFEESDFITCYRTAPHIDVMETRMRAIHTLLNMLKNKNQKVYKTKIDIPILLPGEKTSTEVEPAKSIYKKIDEIVKDEEIFDISIWMGFPWADQKRCHAYIVATGTSKEKIENVSMKLAKEFYDKREKFEFVGPADTLKNAIQISLNSDKKPFFISDTGDNPGAGGVGDMVVLLNEYLKINEKNKIQKKILIASIYDKESISKIYNHSVGDIVKLDLGGKADLSFGGQVKINAEIINKFYGEMQGNSALIKHDNIYIIVTENRFQYGKWEYFENSGISSFDDFDIISVKMGYLEPDLAKAQKGWIMALTPGAVNQALETIDYKFLDRPIFPLDSIDGYKLKNYTL